MIKKGKLTRGRAVTQSIQSPDTSAIVKSESVAAHAVVESPPPTPRRSPRDFDPFEDLAYDPDGINAYYQTRFPSVVSRIFTVLWPILSFALGVWLTNRRGDKSETTQRRQAQRLRELLTDLGPAYIKIG